jgi:hypothetical protein
MPVPAAQENNQQHAGSHGAIISHTHRTMLPVSATCSLFRSEVSYHLLVVTSFLLLVLAVLKEVMSGGQHFLYHEVRSGGQLLLHLDLITFLRVLRGAGPSPLALQSPLIAIVEKPQ